MNRLLVATANRGKLREMGMFLRGLPLEIESLESRPGLVLPPETGDTYAENAMSKAELVAGVSGLPALADDSGLEVDALEGRPGVMSARYGGEGASDDDRVRALVDELDDVAPGLRGATFVCVLALAVPGIPTRLFEGRCRGIITGEPSGTGGFGYDPVFLYPPAGMTFAEMGEDKHRVSHRGLAFSGLRQYLEMVLATDTAD